MSHRCPRHTTAGGLNDLSCRCSTRGGRRCDSGRKDQNRGHLRPAGGSGHMMHQLMRHLVADNIGELAFAAKILEESARNEYRAAAKIQRVWRLHIQGSYLPSGRFARSNTGQARDEAVEIDLQIAVRHYHLIILQLVIEFLRPRAFLLARHERISGIVGESHCISYATAPGWQIEKRRAYRHDFAAETG